MGQEPLDDAALCAFLDARGIAYRRFDHPAVFTCEAAAELVPAEATGVQTKNLFLRDKKGRRHWLVVTDCAKPVDLKALAPLIRADHLSLGSPDRLMRYLGVTPGAVTLMALVNDPGHEVTLVIDREVAGQQWRCHPMVNTATLSLPWESVETFIAALGHVASTVVVPSRS